jgi:hypothetical protein
MVQLGTFLWQKRIRMMVEENSNVRSTSFFTIHSHGQKLLDAAAAAVVVVVLAFIPTYIYIYDTI